MNVISYIKGLLTATLLLPLTLSAAKPQIKLALDSSYIEMGRQTPLTITVTDPSGVPGTLFIQRDSMPAQLEISDIDHLPELQPIDANSKEMFQAIYKLQSFDSGVWRLPPIGYIYGTDTVFSTPVWLKVNPVDVSEMETIDPDVSRLSLGSRWYDFLPDFLTDYWYLLVIALLVIVGGIFAYLILSKKVKVNIMPKKKVIPPYDLAMARLEKLRTEDLWNPGSEKEFYTELTDILREYLERRFGINALEMTSTQILNAIRSREDTRMTESLIRQILEVADFVKFARVQPERDANIRSFESARKFVEDTRPVPEPEDGKDYNTKNTKN